MTIKNVFRDPQLDFDFGEAPDAANDPEFDPHQKTPRQDWRTLEAQRMNRFVRDRAKWHCENCGKWAGYGHGQVDHKLALINGGNNSLDNLQLLCNGCHSYKTSMDILVWARFCSALGRIKDK